MASEYFEVFYRDVLQCVRVLFGDPKFTGVLAFTSERHYADADRTVRVYFDMNTGKWWWSTQVSSQYLHLMHAPHADCITL